MKPKPIDRQPGHGAEADSPPSHSPGPGSHKGEDMERKIVFRPAFDKRHKDPNKNYGIHGVEVGFYLSGEEGAIQFVIYTGWQLPHVTKEFEAEPRSRGLDAPMPADLGYHSHKPMYEGQSVVQEDCHIIGGPCYYDGSSLNAEEPWIFLLEGGDEAVWKYLEDYYKETFGLNPGGES